MRLKAARRGQTYASLESPTSTEGCTSRLLSGLKEGDRIFLVPLYLFV